MDDSASTDSPLEAAADVAGERAIEAFSLLSNETRLAILLALWEAYEPFPNDTWEPRGGNAVPFSELRGRVGVSDSGQFNYHLGKLQGHFIEQTPDGYQLLPAGQKFVETVIGGAGLEEPRLDPTEIDLACFICGAPTAITYQNQRLYLVCTACDGGYDLGENHPSSVLNGYPAAPNVLRDRSPEGIYSAVQTLAMYQFAIRTGGVCPNCSGRLDSSIDACQDHEPGDDAPCSSCNRQSMAVARYVCTACKRTNLAPLPTLAYLHPVGSAIAWKHGIEIGYGSWNPETFSWLSDFEYEQELIKTEPPQVRVTLRHETDEIQLTFDESQEIVELTENY